LQGRLAVLHDGQPREWQEIASPLTLACNDILLDFSPDHQHFVADLEQPEEGFYDGQKQFHQGFRTKQFPQVEIIREG
jgi:hypothetical protein